MDKHFKYIDDDIRFQYLYDEHPEELKFSMHTHEHCELYIFLHGKGVCKIEGSSYPMTTGDIFITRPTECHYMEIEPDYPYERIVIHFRKNSFPAIDVENKLFDAFYKRDLGELNQYSQSNFQPEIFSFIIKNLTEKVQNEHLQLVSNSIVLLNEIYKVFHSNNNNTPTPLTLTNHIIKYLDERLTKSISLDQICRDFYINKTKLCRLFKENTGTSIHNYIVVKRLTNAKIALEQGVTPTKVATLQGYNDYSAFYRAFQKHFGVTPTEVYRNAK